MQTDRPRIPVTTLLTSPRKILQAAREVSKLPNNTPERFLSKPRPKGTVVACLGDSITHGNVSYNWVDSLTSKLGPTGTHFINAGINSSVAWQLNQRLDAILKCKPDIAIILIGTNDAMGSFHPGDGKTYKRKGRLQAIPTLAGYRQQLRKLLRQLQAVPKVAVCSLPPLGEDPLSPINQHVLAFNHDIEQIVNEEHRTLLPLNNRLMDILNNRPTKPQRHYKPGPINRLLPILRAITDHYILELAWDESAASQDLVLLPDHIHLGESGGQILADLVEQFLSAT